MALQDLIDAASPGSTLNITGQTFSGSGGAGENSSVNKALTIIGGTVTGLSTSDPWGAAAMGISADNVTIDGMDIARGSNLFHITHAGGDTGTRSNITIRNTIGTRNGCPGAPLRWHGRHQNITLENNTWIAVASNQSAGIVAGRSDEGNPCGGFADGFIVRNNYFEQGVPGWFGVEIKCMRNILLEGNVIKGGTVLTSWPDCDNVELADNEFYLNSWFDPANGWRPFWGLEQAGPLAHTFYCHGNIIDGGGVASGAFWGGSHLNYPVLSSPVTRLECNIVQNGLSEFMFTGFLTDQTPNGAQKTIVQNNTIPAGTAVVSTNTNQSGNGNTFSNNDADGASGCGGPSIQNAAAVLNAAAQIIANEQLLHYARFGRYGRGRVVL